MKKLVFIFFLGLPPLAQAQIIETSDVSDVESILRNATEEDLVAFDVDEVLLRPQNTLYTHYFSCFKAFLEEQTKTLHLKEKAYISSLFYTPYNMKLVDPEWPKIIHDLQEKKVKTIALTKASSGKLGHFESLSDLRHSILRQNNIHFKRSFPNLSTVKLQDISWRNETDFPLYADGIAYSCAFFKSMILGDFLKHAKWKPRKIFFIDDLIENCADIQDFCANNDIECVCVHFTKITNEEIPDFDNVHAKSECQKLFQDHQRFSKKTKPVFPEQNSALYGSILNSKGIDINNPPYCDHLLWAQKIHDYLINSQSDNEKAIEILSCFDRNDARIFLRPILSFFKFDLTEDLVKQHFKTQVPFVKEDHRLTDSAPFYAENVAATLFTAAQKAYAAIQGQVLFVIGQTPAYLGSMIEEIARLQNDTNTHITYHS